MKPFTARIFDAFLALWSKLGLPSVGAAKKKGRPRTRRRLPPPSSADEIGTEGSMSQTVGEPTEGKPRKVEIETSEKTLEINDVGQKGADALMSNLKEDPWVPEEPEIDQDGGTVQTGAEPARKNRQDDDQAEGEVAESTVGSRADDGTVDHEAVDDDTLGKEQGIPRRDPHPPTSDEGDRVPTLVSPNLQTPEGLPKEPETNSIGMSTLDSGDAADPRAGREANEPREQESTSADDRSARTVRQPTPPEDADEFSVAVPDVSVVCREYARWNNAVVEQLLLIGPSSEEALLCVNPRVLARVFEEASLGPITPRSS